jgi:hypothetical protein
MPNSRLDRDGKHSFAGKTLDALMKIDDSGITGEVFGLRRDT